ncbi:PREDICTED: histone deacetylase HDT2-like [Tarenaya hassleriana]|uniref:histone deacetylase HDT2-like n=1 Tax=Tarenaya hassleriana TaxID=28532 RepID=UPI00053C66C9|nr:PREDICTED: histone deacetylase HDT2-like [Tarenaya hassleriana]
MTRTEGHQSVQESDNDQEDIEIAQNEQGHHQSVQESDNDQEDIEMAQNEQGHHQSVQKSDNDQEDVEFAQHEQGTDDEEDDSDDSDAIPPTPRAVSNIILVSTDDDDGGIPAQEKEDVEVPAAPKDPVQSSKRPKRKIKPTLKSPYTTLGSTDPPSKKRRAKRETRGRKGKKDKDRVESALVPVEEGVSCPVEEGALVPIESALVPISVAPPGYVWIPRQPMVYDNVVRVESFIETNTRKATALFKFMQKPREERLWMSYLNINQTRQPKSVCLL